RCRGRTGAPCQPHGWWVSPARPPNRTCDSHRIRLSTWSCRWAGMRRCWTRPWGRDLGAPVAVALDGERIGSEHVDPSGTDVPSGQVAPDQGVHVQPEVSFAEPPDHPPEGEVIEVAEGPRGHSVTEVCAPASQR